MFKLLLLLYLMLNLNCSGSITDIDNLILYRYQMESLSLEELLLKLKVYKDLNELRLMKLCIRKYDEECPYSDDEYYKKKRITVNYMNSNKKLFKGLHTKSFEIENDINYDVERYLSTAHKGDSFFYPSKHIKTEALFFFADWEDLELCYNRLKEENKNKDSTRNIIYPKSEKIKKEVSQFLEIFMINRKK